MICDTADVQSGVEPASKFRGYDFSNLGSQVSLRVHYCKRD